MSIPKHVFRQYDIRGIVGEDLDEGLARSVGRAFASDLIESRDSDEPPTVVVGGDNRDTTPGLKEALEEGLMGSGARVVDIGIVPTPVLYWAEVTLGADAGMQVTGSHNPSEWNGIKMTVGKGALYGDAIEDLRLRIEKGHLHRGDGSREEVEGILDRYVEDVVGRFELARPIKVAVDCGNGTGALVAVELLEALGAEVTPLFCDSDPSFPNHHPDPTVDANLEDLIRVVQEGDHDLGVAFDGDADRIGAVDETGAIVRGDILLLLYGLDLLERRGAPQKLVFDVKCSQALPEVFEAAGGSPRSHGGCQSGGPHPRGAGG